jgi:hypothetical protein
MPIDEDTPLPREPSTSADFADNMAIYWFDPQGVGGVIGMGQWPNRGEAITYIAAADVSNGHGFQQTRTPFPLDREARTADRLTAGGVTFTRLATGHHHVRAAHGDEVEIELTLTDFYPMTPFPHPERMAVLETVAPDHLESSGRAVGTLTLCGQTTRVDGWFHRDRSWGDRRQNVPVSDYHWSVGTAGPELSWAEIVCTIPGAGTFRNAYVHLDGEVHPCTAGRTYTVVDEDHLTVRGWTTWLTTDTGRELRVHAVDPPVHLLDQRTLPDMTATDTLAWCEVTLDGQHTSAFGALNMIVNPRLGTAPAVRYLGGSILEGAFELPCRG